MSITPPSPPSAVEPWEVLDLLTALVQKSLVVYEEDEQGMSDAGAALPAAGDGAAVRAGSAAGGRRRGGGARAAWECFLQLAEAVCAAAGQEKGVEAFGRLEPEHDNLVNEPCWSR